MLLGESKINTNGWSCTGISVQHCRNLCSALLRVLMTVGVYIRERIALFQLTTMAALISGFLRGCFYP